MSDGLTLILTNKDIWISPWISWGSGARMKKPGSMQETNIEPQLKLRPASEEIINMLAQAPNILEFKPSEEARTRVWELVAREKEGTLNEAKKNELDHYAQIEHLMRMVKAQARKRLKRIS